MSRMPRDIGCWLFKQDALTEDVRVERYKMKNDRDTLNIPSATDRMNGVDSPNMIAIR